MHTHRVEHPFLVGVAALRRQPGARRHLELEGELEDLAVSSSAVPAGATVRFDAVLESVHDGILVTGTVRAPWQGECRRCLEAASGELEVFVRELCVEAGDEETTYPLRAEELDLEPIVHDACILNLPLAPLCSDGCLGLCPSCGANRNLEPCACAPVRDDRWAALAALSGQRERQGDASERAPETIE